ncbi:MAG TPA: hydrogen peroxide-inducible genes activator [Polyangiaceae bacterium]|nr:hydrogen peroxide-inducible genes activator [Polyangiaceae bacterium]
MDLTQVTLAQMRYAVAIAEAESFRVAAERCHVSQSGLSMQLQKLEDLLGSVLFDRSKKPVMLTPEGAAAVDQMRTILRETERLGQILAEEAEPSGRFRLGVIPTLASTVLPLFLKRFVDTYPAVELLIEELKTNEIIARLHADTLDAGLASTPLAEAGLREEVLAYEPLLAYLPHGDPLLGKKTIAQAALQKRELWVMPEGHCFRSQVLAFCGAEWQSEPTRVRFESGSFETLIRLVDAGMGATILPALVVRELDARKRDAQVRPLAGQTPVREIGLITARTELRRRVIEALVSVLREELESALGKGPRRPQVLDPRG